MKQRIVLLLVLIATSLAGCADSASPAEEAEDFSSLDLDVGEDTGIIRGVVIDETVVPVEGATVSLPDGTETTTNAEGLFGFEDLEPATYFLTVSKPGYGKVQQSTEVVAGVSSPPVVKVQLARLADSQPFVVSDYYQAFLSCGFKLANLVFDASWCDPTGAAGYAGSDDPMHTFETGTEAIPLWFQTEVDWQANQPASEGLVTIQCVGDNTGCGSAQGDARLCNTRGPAPLVCAIHAGVTWCEADGEGCAPGGGNNLTAVDDGNGFRGIYSVGIYSNCAVQCVTGRGVGFALEQDVYMYTNVFYNYQPPEGWQFIQDGAYAPPA